MDAISKGTVVEIMKLGRKIPLCPPLSKGEINLDSRLRGNDVRSALCKGRNYDKGS